MDEKIDILNVVKFRLGIFYSNELIDAEIQSMIDECKEYLINAGVSEEQIKGSKLAAGAYALWCKMARSSNPNNMTNHPVLISFIVQMRNRGVKSNE